MDSDTKKPIFKKWWFWAIAVVIVVAIIGKETGGNSVPGPNKSFRFAAKPNVITLAKYNMIHAGMTREAVDKIIDPNNGDSIGIVGWISGEERDTSVEAMRELRKFAEENQGDFPVTYGGNSYVDSNGYGHYPTATITYTGYMSEHQKVVNKTKSDLR